MPNASTRTIMSSPVDCDVVVAGASLAGCTTALLLGRAGARVTLVDQRPDPHAYKRICGHYIQPSGIGTLERTGLLDLILAAGGVRSALRMWTPWGVVEAPDPDRIPLGVNIRRQRLDPLLRGVAAEQDGVDLLLGQTVTQVVGGERGVRTVVVRDRHGRERRLRARLVVGADGRGSKVAELARVPARTSPHRRFSYGAYYKTPGADSDGRIWMLDPHWAAAFPTDSGLTLFACMPTKDRLPEFRGDLAGALESFLASVPGAPPIREMERVTEVFGKVEMPNVQRGPVAPGLALVGDAALATDPLWGVGCGWAFQTAEWLAQSVAPALGGSEPLQAGLRRYRRRFRRRLGGHAMMIRDYANGRRMTPIERVLFHTAAHDRRAAEIVGRYGARLTGPESLLSPRLAARVAVTQLRRRRSDSHAADQADAAQVAHVPHMTTWA